MRLTATLTGLAAAVAGVFGAGVAHDQVRRPAPEVAPPIDHPIVIPAYQPCKKPAVLTDGECVTTVTIYRLPRMTPAPVAPKKVVVIRNVTVVPTRHEDDDEHEHEGEDD